MILWIGWAQLISSPAGSMVAAPKTASLIVWGLGWDKQKAGLSWTVAQLAFLPPVSIQYQGLSLTCGPRHARAHKPSFFFYSFCFLVKAWLLLILHQDILHALEIKCLEMKTD